MSTPGQQANTDRARIDAFARRGIFETADFQSFWSQLVGELTFQRHRLPGDDAHLRWKGELAIQWLRALLCNFYEDTAEAFYWKPRPMRQAVYYAAIELYPKAVLRAGFPGRTQLVESVVQDVLLAEFEALGENDILFIDSQPPVTDGQRRCVRVSGNVPREYSREWVLGMNRYWTEQYVLQAFLAFNERFEILAPGAYLHTGAGSLGRIVSRIQPRLRVDSEQLLDEETEKTRVATHM